ncbi:hypothetical protein [Microbulbifer sp. Q7]|uniref:hypothetical protein n=1 Tax=Microbulbifer sp. Q7 TaxID=1785091 RepID=UPI00082C9E6C|nr:hypothetical protein [Microbulbifer sp. Q7]
MPPLQSLKAAAITVTISSLMSANVLASPQPTIEPADLTKTESQSAKSSFAVDIPGLIQAAISKALEDHDAFGYEDFVLEQKSIYFHCDSEARWRYVDAFTLNLPNQSGAASLCQTSLMLIIKETLQENRTSAAGAEGYCYDTIDFESITATVYGSGLIETHRGKGHHGGTISCDEQRIFLSIDEAIAQHTSKAKPDQDSPQEY